jgi:two-component system, chemotaxis family, sensor kinase CheA
MTPDDLNERLLTTFVQELEEQVRELNSGLLALEQQPRDVELVRSLFRAAHTIKGAARVAGVPLVEQACHELESVFADVRDARRQLEGADFSLLFAVIDALSEYRTLRRSGDDAADGTLGSLLPRLAQLSAGDPAERPRDGEIRGSGPARPVATPSRSAAGTVAAAARSGSTAAPASAPQSSTGRGDAPAPDPPRSTDTVPTEAAAAAAQSGDGGAGGELVRVRADRLDALLSASGELIIATGRIVERHGGQDEDARRLDRVTTSVTEVVRDLRLRPFADACEALPRAVRDVAAGAGKQVVLEVRGQDVEADRIVVDALREPLLHLVRNAVDHGIEAPAERERSGKPQTGTIRVAAELVGGRLTITVSDDGAGVDEKAVRAALRERGRAVSGGRDALAAALLRGGVSTRHEASTISGRGVGLDLVRTAVERIGGTLYVQWSAGTGSSFTLECPPTPANIRALLVRVGAYVFAIPTVHVRRLRRVRPGDLLTAEGHAVLPTSQGPIPVRSMAELLGPPFEAHPGADVATVVTVVAGSKRLALMVDGAIAEDDIVVRPLDVDRGAVPFAAGASILPSGRVALVLAVGALLAAAQAGTAIAPAFTAGLATPRQRVLVADDSITTRTLMQSLLESAGYEVTIAVDGEDAWRRLEQQGVALVVADVEMPKMDGFALCRRIRGSAQYADLPIVLVTGLESAEDRARGLEAGADAYIVKSDFDQASLLDVVRQLIGGA